MSGAVGQPVSAAGGAEQMLGAAQLMVEPALRAAVRSLLRDNRRVVEYHLAGSGAALALAPALALVGAAAAGGPWEVAVPGAAAVAVVQHFSLLHDDVMNRTAERRGRPTAWAVFGESEAVCASDALLIAAVQLLADQPDALRVLLPAAQEVIAGQAADGAMVVDLAFGRERYVRLAEGTTGALLGCAASIGAVLASGDRCLVAGLTRFGRALGVLHHMVDDILDVWGRSWASLPILCGLDADHYLLVDEAGACRPASDVVDRLNACGAYVAARAEAVRQCDVALAAVEILPMPDAARAPLRALAAYLLACAGPGKAVSAEM